MHDKAALVCLEDFAIGIHVNASVERQVKGGRSKVDDLSTVTLFAGGELLQHAHKLERRHMRHDEYIEKSVVDPGVWSNRVAATNERGVAHRKHADGQRSVPG